MTRTMYDAINPAGIPANPPMVAGYDDGRWPDFATMVTMFPHAIHVPVTVFASDNEGIVLDVETGDATPAQAPGWVLTRRAAGVDPSVYCNASTWPSVIQAFLAARVAMPHWWIAQYDGNTTLPSIIVNGVTYTAVAKQYGDPVNYDVSAVAEYWPGVDQGGPVSEPIYEQASDWRTYAQTYGLTTVPHSDQWGVPNEVNQQQVTLNAILAGVTAANSKLDALATAEAQTDADVKTTGASILSAVAAGVQVTLTAEQAAQIETQLAHALPGYVVNITPAPTPAG